MINLTIDGKPVEVQDGITVLQAAQAAGIHIPTLCAHPALKPFGGCRLCLVEVEGMRTLQPSCTMPVSSNMIVKTGTDKVKAARRFVLNMIFSDRNHFCPYCQVTGGDCELQNAALNENMSHWSFPPNWDRYPVDASHPHFVLDHNRCILCHRCVRACGQLVGNFTLGIEERGARSMLVADTGTPWGESSCVSCGTCAAICPTGAIFERGYAYQGHDSEMDITKSVCVGCSVGCGTQVYARNNSVLRVIGDWDAPINNGVMCEAGRFGLIEEQRERITTPMVRKNGKLEAATWEEALAAVAGQAKQGVAAVASTRLPVEALSYFQQIFGGGLNSDMVTSTEEGQATANAYALAKELGHPFESSLDAIKSAGAVFSIGSGVGTEHQVAGFLIQRNLPNGAKLVVMEKEMDNLGARANVFLQACANCKAADVLKGVSAGMVQLGVIEGNAEQAKQELAEAAQASGLTEDQLLAAAGMIGSSDKPVFVYGASLKVDVLRKVVELAGKLNGALVSVKGQANSVAAAQLGLDKAFQLNGHKAAYVALGDEAPAASLVENLKKAPFLAVQTSYASELTEQANVVLPTEIWSEEEGTYVNLEGRAQKTTRSVTAPAGVRSNAAVLEGLAKELNVSLNAGWQQVVCERPAPVAVSF